MHRWDPIAGIARPPAEVRLAEVGPDLRRFASAAHLAAWAGVAPGNTESGGKHRSGTTRKGRQGLRTGLGFARKLVAGLVLSGARACEHSILHAGRTYG